MDLLRLLHTVRYLKPVQVYGRLWFRLHRPRVASQSTLPLRPVLKAWKDPCGASPSCLGPNLFRFLNQTRYCEFPRDWNNPGWDKLWLYNLHYFDFLMARGGASRRQQAGFIDAWIAGNPPGFGNGWEPYPTSLRIVNWIKWSLSGHPLSTEMFKSLTAQARYLRRRLEVHLQGNHLLANAKALVFAGLFFSGNEPDQWLNKGLAILDREIPEQILSDGGHFERSPMYHAIVLEDLLDLINMMATYGHAIPALWSEKAAKMLSWLFGMSHPDGQIALLNDAAFGVAPTPVALSRYAGRLGIEMPATAVSKSTHFPLTGYLRAQHGPALAILDVAPVGPDYLPGHAHADSLSFELSLFGQRLVVDSGCSCYGDSGERLRQRGTAAHNTVTINGENSSEVWGGFRVARRARPRDLRVEITPCETRVACAHSGYRRLPGRPVHLRRWTLTDAALQIHDVIHGPYKEAIGRFHLHPDVRAVNHVSPTTVRLMLNGGERVGFSLDGGEVRVVESSWHPEFGSTRPSLCLEVVFKQGDVNAKFWW